MSIVVIGNFDGVHKGHQQILNRAKAIAGDEKIVANYFE
jgi:riboflavin kinase/FMN adenylyltransferase